MKLDQEPSLLCFVDTTCRPTACSVMIPDGCQLPSLAASGVSVTEEPLTSNLNGSCGKLGVASREQENRKRKHSIKEGKVGEKKSKSSSSPPKDLTNI